jgi:hypothetical protein
LTAECTVDTTKTGYELAKSYDDCLIGEAQKSTAHIDPSAIKIRATETTLTNFGSSYATLNAQAGWVQAHYTFLPEDMSAYPDAPPIIDGVVMTKMKSKARDCASMSKKLSTIRCCTPSSPRQSAKNTRPMG